MTTIHTEGDTVVIDQIVRIKCRDEENAILFAASFESDIYHHTPNAIQQLRDFYTVIRRGQQESEGNPIDIDTYETEKEAQDWIAAQEGEYYSPGQYYVRVDRKPVDR
jgi:hypothetical protein